MSTPKLIQLSDADEHESTQAIERIDRMCRRVENAEQALQKMKAVVAELKTQEATPAWWSRALRHMRGLTKTKTTTHSAHNHSANSTHIGRISHE